MNRAQLEHIIRAAASIAEAWICTEFYRHSRPLSTDHRPLLTVSPVLARLSP